MSLSQKEGDVRGREGEDRVGVISKKSVCWITVAPRISLHHEWEASFGACLHLSGSDRVSL